MRKLWIRLWISGLTMASAALGIFLISWGNRLGAQNYYYNVEPWGLWGAFFIALPVIAGAIRLLAAIAKAIAAEHQRYLAWKAALTPEQRAAVELGELAALTAAAIAMHERHKRRDAELTSSVMGYTMPDGYTPRPSQRIAAYREIRQSMPCAQEAPWQAGQQVRQQPLQPRIWQPPGQEP